MSTNEVLPTDTAMSARRTNGGSGSENAIVAAAAERSRAEVESALIVAKRFPRREADASARILEMCERESFANVGVYSYPRGGGTVEGPSVNLARQAERLWGNIMSGFEVLAMDDEYIHLRGYAMDLETNTRKIQEHRFTRKIQRKDKRSGETKWIEITDERELRELIGRQGSILERNCILRLLPADLVDDAKERCKRTMRKAAAGDLTKSRAETIRGVVFGFRSFGVDVDMLEKKLGHSVDLINEEELTGLRKIHNALKDGQAKRTDFFDVPGVSRDSGSVERSEDILKPKAAQAKAEPAAEVEERDPWTDPVEVAPE